MIRLTRTANPVVLPVTLEEFNIQARIDYRRPEVFPRIGAVATAVVEAYTRRSLITQEWTLTADCFPSGRTFVLPRGPVQEITSISYLDADGASQALATADYGFTSDGQAFLMPEASWPATFGTSAAVTIVYITGYGDTPDQVPEELRHAVLMLSTYYYDTPSIASTEGLKQVPFGISALLSPFKNPFDIQPVCGCG